MDTIGTFTRFEVQTRDPDGTWSLVFDVPDAASAEKYLTRLRAAAPNNPNRYRAVRVDVARSVYEPAVLEV